MKSRSETYSEYEETLTEITRFPESMAQVANELAAIRRRGEEAVAVGTRARKRTVRDRLSEASKAVAAAKSALMSAGVDLSGLHSKRESRFESASNAVTQPDLQSLEQLTVQIQALHVAIDDGLVALKSARLFELRRMEREEEARRRYLIWRQRAVMAVVVGLLSISAAVLYAIYT